MNILFLLGVYPAYGGVEKVTTILSNAFVENGHNVAIVSFDQPYPELASTELSDKVKLYKLAYPVRKKENTEALRDILLKEQTNIIIKQWAVPWYVTKLCKDASQELNVKLLTVHHNQPDTNARIKGIEIDLENKTGNPIVNRLKLWTIKLVSRLSLRYVFERSDCFIILSSHFISDLKRFIGKNINDSKLIPLANPLTIPKSENNYIKRKEILVVGRIEYNQKRTFRVAEIWEKLYRRFPEWHLVIVGDGPDREDLESRFHKLGLRNYSFEGYQNPVNYYERASIQLLVSEYEGFGLVLVEGMSRGCVPIVLDSYAAAKDVVPDDSVGLRLPYPFNVKAFSENLSNLMSDSERLKNMRESSKLFAKKYSLPSILDQWESIINFYGSV